MSRVLRGAWSGPVLLAGTALLAIVIWLHGQPLITGAAPHGGVSLQLARTLDVARSILDSWRLEGQLPAAKPYVHLDFFFIPLYTALLVYASLWQRGRAIGKWKTLAATTVLLTGLAAVLNLIGDIGQLRLLDAFGMSGPLPGTESLTLTLVYLSSVSKFLFIGLAAAFLFVLDVRRVSADARRVAPDRRPNLIRPEDL